MKKLMLIMLLVAIAFISNAQTFGKKYSPNNIWWGNYNKFSNELYKCNSGGTITDTLDSKSSVRSQVAVKLNTATFTAFVADTITRSAAMLEYFATLPTYVNNAAAYAALGAGKPYFLETGQLARTFAP